MAPLSHYDKNKGGERPQIQINVSGINDIKTEKVIEGVVEPSNELEVLDESTAIRPAD